MIEIILERIRQGHRTNRFPDQIPPLPERYNGAVQIDFSKCEKNCEQCSIVCPTSAIESSEEGICAFDIGSCIFCGKCSKVCPNNAITFTKNHEMTYYKRSSMILGNSKPDGLAQKDSERRKEISRLFGRSLKLRQVSAGGCNACEADINVLQTLAWDIGRFGIQIVA